MRFDTKNSLHQNKATPFRIEFDVDIPDIVEKDRYDQNVNSGEYATNIDMNTIKISLRYLSVETPNLPKNLGEISGFVESLRENISKNIETREQELKVIKNNIEVLENLSKKLTGLNWLIKLFKKLSETKLDLHKRKKDIENKIENKKSGDPIAKLKKDLKKTNEEIKKIEKKITKLETDLKSKTYEFREKWNNFFGNKPSSTDTDDLKRRLEVQKEKLNEQKKDIEYDIKLSKKYLDKKEVTHDTAHSEEHQKNSIKHDGLNM